MIHILLRKLTIFCLRWRPLCWPRPPPKKPAARPPSATPHRQSRSSKRISAISSSGRRPSRSRSAIRSPRLCRDFMRSNVRGSQGEASQRKPSTFPRMDRRLFAAPFSTSIRIRFKIRSRQAENRVPAQLSARRARRSCWSNSATSNARTAAQEAQMLRQNLLKAYPKEVRLYYPRFPARIAASWAKDAAMMGPLHLPSERRGFWDYHDWIFQNQDRDYARYLEDQGARLRGDAKASMRTSFRSASIRARLKKKWPRTRAEGHESRSGSDADACS